MTRGLFASLILALAAFGCGGREADLERAPYWLPPLALGEQLVLIDSAGSRALLVDIGADPLQAHAEIAELPHAPSFAQKRNGSDEALVLCAGRRATADEDAEPAALAVLQADGEVRSYGVGANPFDSIQQSEDGRYAFLFKRPGSAQRLLDNPNEVAIVDLDQVPSSPEGSEGVSLRTLRSFGDSPLAVVFSPPMRILSEDRRLAVVLSQTNVTLIDLDHLDRIETTVQLSSPGGSAVSPTQIVFNPQAPEIYVRGVGSDDVFVFNLGERPPADDVPDDGTHNDFRPFIDQLGVGGRPTDMALYTLADSSARVLVLADSSQATVVEASTSRVSSVDLPASATNALLFSGPSPRDRTSAQRALLYQPNSNQVMFLDLEDLELRGSRNLEQLTLPNSITKVVPMLEEQRVLIIHDTGGVSLLDLGGRTVSPIASTARLSDALFDPERGKLWVGPAGQRFVALLDLATGDTPEVLLDADVETLVPMFDVGHVVVLHTSKVGHLTVLDADNPTRESARSLRGFQVADLLDRGE